MWSIRTHLELSLQFVMNAASKYLTLVNDNFQVFLTLRDLSFISSCSSSSDLSVSRAFIYIWVSSNSLWIQKFKFIQSRKCISTVLSSFWLIYSTMASVWRFLQFHILCMWAAKALARMCWSAVWLEPSQFLSVIGTLFIWDGLDNRHHFPYEPAHNKTNKMTSAPSKDSDQPGHLPSLIGVFAERFLGSLGPNASSCGQ